MLSQDHHIQTLKMILDLIKSPGLDLFSTFDFKERLKNFFRKKE